MSQFDFKKRLLYSDLERLYNRQWHDELLDNFDVANSLGIHKDPLTFPYTSMTPIGLNEWHTVCPLDNWAIICKDSKLGSRLQAEISNILANIGKQRVEPPRVLSEYSFGLQAVVSTSPLQT